MHQFGAPTIVQGFLSSKHREKRSSLPKSTGGWLASSPEVEKIPCRAFGVVAKQRCKSLADGGRFPSTEPRRVHPTARREIWDTPSHGRCLMVGQPVAQTEATQGDPERASHCEHRDRCLAQPPQTNHGMCQPGREGENGATLNPEIKDDTSNASWRTRANSLSSPGEPSTNARNPLPACPDTKAHSRLTF